MNAVEHKALTPFGVAQMMSRGIRANYTHIGLNDQTTAIELLPAPPELAPGKPSTEQNSANGNGGGCKVKTSSGEVASGGNGQSPLPISDRGKLDAIWPALPDSVKAGILAMIHAAVEPGEGAVAT